MKQCTKCGLSKELSEFHLKHGTPISICKFCKSSISRQHYLDNSSAYKKRAISARARIAELSKRLRQQPCVDCKKTYPPVCMDFDHRPGTEKIANVSDLVNDNRINQFNEEVKKCDVVCSNCHRIRTSKRERCI